MTEAQVIREAAKLAELRTAELRALEAADAEGKTVSRHYRRDLIAEARPYDGQLKAYERCGRCGGTGHVGAGNAVDGTKCYGCWYTPGKGALVAVDAKTILRLEREADRRAAKREREHADRRARWDREAAEGRAEVERDFPEAFAILNGYEGDNKFIADVAERMARFGRLKREGDMGRIAAAIVDAHARDTKAAEAPPVPAGRTTVVGEVVSAKWQFSQYGATLKMLVKTDAGYKVWGSVPRDLEVDEDTRGVRVQFDATLEPSNDDPSFGFFKRPTKAAML